MVCINTMAILNSIEFNSNTGCGGKSLKNDLLNRKSNKLQKLFK